MTNPVTALNIFFVLLGLTAGYIMGVYIGGKSR